MDCDLAKKGDKIDYAIKKDDNVILLIECKQCNLKLDLHSAQLSKYYAASNAKFGVLTNGVEYRFYADLDKINIMDEKPFLAVDMLDISDADIEQLKKFHKSYFNESGILDTAQELKYSTEIKSILSNEFSSPSYEFVRFIAKQVYTSGKVGPIVIEQFTPIVKKSINAIINEIIQDRLELAGKTSQQETDIDNSSIKQYVKNEDSTNETLPDGVVYIDKDNEIVTTQEEIDAYNIIRSIVRNVVPINKIVYKDFKSYFAIGIVNTSYWWGCRLYFGSRKKSIYFPANDYKSQERVDIQSLDDIFEHSDKLQQWFKIANDYYDKYIEKHNN